MKFIECEMFRATCPATMSPKHCETSLHETFHSVTAPQQIKEEKTQNWFFEKTETQQFRQLLKCQSDFARLRSSTRALAVSCSRSISKDGAL